jgi:hypothetical protein
LTAGLVYNVQTILRIRFRLVLRLVICSFVALEDFHRVMDEGLPDEEDYVGGCNSFHLLFCCSSEVSEGEGACSGWWVMGCGDELLVGPRGRQGYHYSRDRLFFTTLDLFPPPIIAI